MASSLPELDFEKALMFFHAYMYGPLNGKKRLYEARNLSTGGLLNPSDFEVFASLLLGDEGTNLRSGVDLTSFEVKSARDRSSFEYQYHRHSWQQKFERDVEVGHLFFSYSDGLRDVSLRYIYGSELAGPFLEPWLRECPYPVNPGAQRYRKSISYGWVQQHAKLLMALKDGEVTAISHDAL